MNWLFDLRHRVWSVLSGNKDGAIFRVVRVDPEGSGSDYAGHLGAYVYNVKRCCANCATAFGSFDRGVDPSNGPQFILGELHPVNRPAKALSAELGWCAT